MAIIDINNIGNYNSNREKCNIKYVVVKLDSITMV
jgi:hypothetical protein